MKPSTPKILHKVALFIKKTSIIHQICAQWKN